MRVLIIAFSDKFIDKIHNQLETEHHQVVRINLYLNEKVPSLKIKDTKIQTIGLNNFHDITIEIMDFEPEVVLYFPLIVDIRSDNSIEIFDIIHVELVEHLIEILHVVNSKLYFMNLKLDENIGESFDEGNLINFDLKRILEKRNKLIISNSKSDFLITENSIVNFEKIVEAITGYLKQ